MDKLFDVRTVTDGERICVAGEYSVYDEYVQFQQLCFLETSTRTTPKLGRKLSGEQITLPEVVNSILAGVIREDKEIEIFFLCDTMKQFLNKQRGQLVLQFGTQNIYSKYRNGVDIHSRLYQLCFVTDKFCYYSNQEGEMLVISSYDGSLVTDVSAFAKEAMSEDFIRIQAGESTLLWGGPV